MRYAGAILAVGTLVAGTLGTGTLLSGTPVSAAPPALAPAGSPANAAPPAGSPANAAPLVQPSLRQWAGGAGHFTVGPRTRIVVDSRNAAALRSDARTFSDDLAAITGRRISVAAAREPRPGDIFLAADATGLPAQGYQLDIATAVTVRGIDATGTFYGEQTIEQALKLDPAHRTLPRGSARDWPDYRDRGFMLDVGRHYYAPADVEQQIRDAAWQKLDVVHLHLTEAAGFRLQSTTYPGLAAAQSYSHADVRRFVEVAHRYHVTLIPEIDMPAHASPITSYDPALKWSCASMSGDPWGGEPGFTLDVTKPATTTFVTNLLKEFVPLFRYSPIIHLGGDEYPYLAQQQQCPELVAYAKANGYASTEDVITAWLNKISGVVTGMGRRPEIWNWWDVAGGATIAPDRNVIIDGWTGTADAYLAAGYDTISSPSDQLYATPGGAPGGTLLPDDKKLYETWKPTADQHLLGYEISRWADGTTGLPDAYLNWFGERSDAVLAAVTWNGPRAASLFAFEDQLDAIGAPPGIPETRSPGSVRLTGTPYGSGPAWDNGSTTADKAFDGDISTVVDLAQASGGYAGIDLGAGNAAPVTAVRFVPRDASVNNTGRMVGGTFQGCTTGPDSGCHDLGRIRWRPTYDWIQLPVADQTRYRWLRYVSPDNGFTDVAEIEFYTAAPAAAAVHLDAPHIMSPLGDNRVRATITNTTGAVLHQVDATLAGYSSDDRSTLPTNPLTQRINTLRPHESRTVSWLVTVPLAATAGNYRLDADVRWQAGRGSPGATETATATTVPVPVVATVDPSSLTLPASGSGTETITLASSAGAPVTVDWKAAPPANASIHPPSGRITVPPGGSVPVPMHITVDATPGVTSIPVTLTAQSHGQTRALDPLALHVAIPYTSFDQAYDNLAITDDADSQPADLNGGADGDGSSYSAQALAAAGVTPGRTVSRHGISFTWPNTGSGRADNALADGQVIDLGGSGHTLGLLTVGTYGPVSGTGTVTYTDGTTQQFTITDPDWQINPVPAGNDVAITTAYHNYGGNKVEHNTYVFYHGVTLDPARSVASVTLPTVSDHTTGSTASIHVFAVAVG